MLCIVKDCGAKQTRTTDFCKSHEKTWCESPHRKMIDWRNSAEYAEIVKQFAFDIFQNEIVQEEEIDEIN